jgi:N-acyl-D-aspartate/D-glutamate deacylase
VYDLLLTGGTVVDGSGAASFAADVAIKAGRIVAVGGLAGAEAARTIDCTGRCVSPGWVDFHGHADWTVFDHPLGLNLLLQGCTTTVSGNCGLGAAPVEGRFTEMLAQRDADAGPRAGAGGTPSAPSDIASGVVASGGHAQTIKRLSEQHAGFRWSFGQFLDDVEAAKPGVNYVQLAPHNTVRRCVMGNDQRPATETEIASMAELVGRCMAEGAFGLSSGLVFIPGCWSKPEELAPLCKVVADGGGYYASHIRGERETNIEATAEFLATIEQSGVRGNVSHMQSKWPVLGNGIRKVEMIEAARARGFDITCDYEIYNRNRGSVGGFLQIYHYTIDQILEKLRTPEGRAEFKRTMRETDPWHPLGRFGPGGVPYRRAWDRITIWHCAHDPSLEGKSIAAVGAERGIDYEDALFDLTLAENGQGPWLINDYIEDEHYRIAPWQQCILPSIDTGLFDPVTHFSELDFRYQLDVGAPSTIGMAPRVLGQFVRQEKLLKLEDAIRRMTSLPMRMVGISDRGYVRPGMWADITVFDPATVGMRSADARSDNARSCWPAGIDWVLVNGEAVMRGHECTGARAGQVLRKG